MTNQNHLPAWHGKNLYWFGSRFSDCAVFEQKLSGSVCLYGESHGKHIAVNDILHGRFDNNEISDAVNAFFRSKLFEILREDEDAYFCFYNPCWKYDIGGLDSVADRLIGVNEKHFYELYGSKIRTRMHLQDAVNLLDARVVERKDCSYAAFAELMGESEYGYILQAECSSGGLGTLIVDQHNRDTFCKNLKDGSYILSKYYKENIPVNYHVVIYSDYVMVLPGSIQILRNEDHRLIYKGADYFAYRSIDPEKRKEMIESVRKVADIMRRDGYRGVAGIDGILVDGNAYVIEVNTRLQGSTASLNMGLSEQGFKTVQELHLEAFCKSEPDEKEKQLDDQICIDYSSYSFAKRMPYEHAEMIQARNHLEPHAVRMDLDGYQAGEAVADGIYTFRICYDTNICAINPDGGIWIHENVSEPTEDMYRKILSGDILATKITLMTQGVFIEEDVKEYLTQNGGIREGNNNAVDMVFRGLVINAPLDVEFNAYAPFSIHLNEQKALVLYYYGHHLGEVQLFPLDPLSGKRTKSGRYYADIAYLSTDRLRVHMTNRCIYKRLGRSCRFCNIDTEDSGQVIPIEDIAEVVEDYLNNAPELKHFLVGGQSAEEISEKTHVIDIIRTIRQRTDKNIYAMVLPFSRKSIQEMHDAGLTELACNMEVYDDQLAVKYMPGKGLIKRKHYIDVLSYAAGLYEPHSGVVRSALILGLEPKQSFMAGVQHLIENDIQPIISVFRPLPKTDLERYMMPPAQMLYDLFIEAETLCRKYHLTLGPACINCQNNTLSLPDEIAKQYVSSCE